MNKLDQRRTVGWRIRDARAKKGITQQQLAAHVGLKRSAIAQWERNESTPSLQTINSIAKYLGTRPEFLAFGISDEPITVFPEPEELGYALVPEVVFGDLPGEQQTVRKWGLPTDWLKSELGIVDPSKLILYKVPVDTGVAEYGDRVIVDTSHTKPSPPGHYLYWDGLGPVLAHISVVPSGSSRKMMARVTSDLGQYEVDTEKLAVIGRVRGSWRKV